MLSLVFFYLAMHHTNYTFYLVYQAIDDTIDCRLGKFMKIFVTKTQKHIPWINRPQNEKLDRGVRCCDMNGTACYNKDVNEENCLQDDNQKEDDEFTLGSLPSNIYKNNTNSRPNTTKVLYIQNVIVLKQILHYNLLDQRIKILLKEIKNI